MLRPDRRIPLALALLVAAGCSCDDEEDLVVDGEAGYVRCFRAAAPEARTWQVAGRTLALDEDRHLSISGATTPIRLVAAAGPVGDVTTLRELRPDVVALLGDVAPRSLPELADLGAVVLVIPGGADEHAPLAEAFAALEGEAADRVLDAGVLRSIRVGPVELVPVAGAPGGRYATGPGACGLGDDDVDAWDLGAPEDGVHRVLLSWAGPTGDGADSVTRGLENVEAGSPLIRRIAEETGAEGAIFAWPRTHAGRIEAPGTWQARVSVRPLAGPAVLRADGTRVAPGPTLLGLDAEGVSASP